MTALFITVLCLGVIALLLMIVAMSISIIVDIKRDMKELRDDKRRQNKSYE